jgi:hypothetical protein
VSAERLPVLDRQNLFPGNSELSRLIRQLDWSKTDLGEPEDWPEHWKTAVRLCLTSRIPVVMYWGANFTVLYNDPYISFLGETKHPYYLGRPGQECWSEIWETIGPMLQSVYATAQATWSEDVLMFFARNLPREEVYVRFTFGPMLAADGRTVDGIFVRAPKRPSKSLRQGGSRRSGSLEFSRLKRVPSRPRAASLPKFLAQIRTMFPSPQSISSMTRKRMQTSLPRSAFQQTTRFQELFH